MNADQGSVGVNTPASKNSKDQKKKAIKVILLVLVVLGAGLFLLADKGLSESDLVVKTKSGVEFKVPEKWQIADLDDEDIEVAYTEDGSNPLDKDSAQSFKLGVDSLGVDYANLTSEQKEALNNSFDEQFSDRETLEGDGCDKVGDIDFGKIDQQGYDVAYLLEAECLEQESREGKAIAKSFIGISGERMHFVAVRADSDLWDKNGTVYDLMLESVKPAN